MMTDKQLNEIKKRNEDRTPGTWSWYGNTDTKTIQLATKERGRQFIMTFFRWGMQSATPAFRYGKEPSVIMEKADKFVIYEKDYRRDFFKLNSPDAEFIAHAPADITALLADNEELRAENKTLHDRYYRWVENYGALDIENKELRAEVERLGNMVADHVAENVDLLAEVEKSSSITSDLAIDAIWGMTKLTKERDELQADFDLFRESTRLAFEKIDLLMKAGNEGAQENIDINEKLLAERKELITEIDRLKARIEELENDGR